jgi:hypothetical protein
MVRSVRGPPDARFYYCVDGMCGCPADRPTLCYRQIEWFECANLQTDPGHCGDCDTWVSKRQAGLMQCDQGSTCVNGKCTGCSGNQKLCAGKCINPANDNKHCGQCYEEVGGEEARGDVADSSAGWAATVSTGAVRQTTAARLPRLAATARAATSSTTTSTAARVAREYVTPRSSSHQCAVGKNCVGGVCR